MELTILDYSLWIAGFAGHLVLFFTLLGKRRISTFPCFGVLIAFSIMRTIVLFYEHRVGAYQYFFTYWALMFVDMLLQILVLSEAAAKIFRPLGRLSADVKRPLTLIAAASVVVALGISCLSSPSELSPDSRFVLRMALFSTALTSEMFVGLVLLSVTSGFVWKSHVAIIVRGLGFYSVVALLIEGLQGYFGMTNFPQLFAATSRLQIVSYMVCLFYWVFGLLRPSPATQPIPAEVITQLERIDGYLSTALSQIRLGGTPS